MERKNYKLELVNYLLENSWTIDEILNLTKEGVTKRGLESDKRETKISADMLPILSHYLQSQTKRDMLKSFIFTDRDGNKLSPTALKIALRSWCKINNRDYAKYGFSKTREAKPKVVLNSMDDIAKWLHKSE